MRDDGAHERGSTGVGVGGDRGPLPEKETVEAEAMTRALSSASALQKALCVIKLSFLHQQEDSIFYYLSNLLIKKLNF